MSPAQIVAVGFLAVGVLLLLAGAVGVMRFPDIYTRLHAAGKADTMGQALILVGLAIPVGLGIVTLKIALILLFVFVLNPTATHALARGAWIVGLRPWQRPEDVDRSGGASGADGDADTEAAEPPEATP